VGATIIERKEKSWGGKKDGEEEKLETNKKGIVQSGERPLYENVCWLVFCHPFYFV